jgi:hypothetical protein
MSRHEELLGWSKTAYLVLMLAEMVVLKEDTDLIQHVYDLVSVFIKMHEA